MRRRDRIKDAAALSTLQDPSAALANLTNDDIAVRKKILYHLGNGGSGDKKTVAKACDIPLTLAHYLLEEMFAEKLVDRVLQDPSTGLVYYEANQNGRRFWAKGPSKVKV